MIVEDDEEEIPISPTSHVSRHIIHETYTAPEIAPAADKVGGEIMTMSPDVSPAPTFQINKDNLLEFSEELVDGTEGLNISELEEIAVILAAIVQNHGAIVDRDVILREARRMLPGVVKLFGVSEEDDDDQ